MSLHAHIVKSSRDCDGLYDSTYVEQPDPGQDPDDFRDRITALRLPWKHDMTDPNGEPFHIEVRFTVGGFSWSAPTDEGFTSTEVQWCEDECDLGERTFRDHTAEAAGY